MQRILNVFRVRVPARAAAAGVLAPALAALSIGAPQGAPPADAADAARQPTLEETRLTLAKWIETQQIIAKERNDWQQGKEILQGRIDLVGKEVGVLKERIRQSEEAVAQSDRKRDELLAQDAELKTLGEQLATAATVMEEQIRSLVKQLPDPVKGRIAPLVERIPADPAATRVTPAERFQNVLGILNEVNKANSEISVAYEIRTLADGSSSEVQVIYLGLAQAYFLSPKGEAGIGRPTEDGWKWEPAPGAADQILLALEVIEGKHVPTFVPLPIKIR
ncbi:MAG: DUF3450 domain-containing protein [Phycisphaerales bacterium]|nr:DUF3450 domain-containing protein [Phycisphaerales bacterium]